MQGGKRPTKAEQDWQDWQRSQGCCGCGAAQASIHHCTGSTAKHNKIHIGQWWTLPLCYECHQGPEGIHNHMGMFEPYPDDWDRKELEKDLFEQICISYAIDTSEYIPVPDEVYNAIMDYHK